MAERIYIFDTTLRDGQQCPGAGMSFENNLAYFELAMKLGVDVVEAGFPSASKVDFDIVHEIAKQFSGHERCPTIAGLCQTRAEQVEATIRSLIPAVPHGKARLHMYLPVDPVLMQASLGARANDKLGLIAEVAAFIRQARAAGLGVEFSPEGYSRLGENFDFVSDLLVAAVQSGAEVINCPDTIGGAYRYQGKDYFVEFMRKHAEIVSRECPGKPVLWSTHCHNDFGLAVENSMTAVLEGPARQIEGCINGIGERAGNAALEQCIMLLAGLPDSAGKKFYTAARSEHLREISDFVAKYMLPRQPHSPIVGANAACHSSGGHTNAILKNPLAYQPFDPKAVGSEISFVFGPLSGGNHAKSVVEKAGYQCKDEEKADLAQFLKNLYADRRKGITDEELLKGYFAFREPIRLESIDYAKSARRATVMLVGKVFEKQGNFEASNEGQDSALAALKRLLDGEMPGYNVHSHRSLSKGQGIEAVSVSEIVLTNADGLSFVGSGEDRDIEISAMKALIDSYNRAFIEINFRREHVA